MRTYPSRPGPHVPTKADAGVPDPHVQVGCGPHAFTRRRPGLRRPKPGPLLAARSLGRCSSVVLPAQQGQRARAPPLRCCPLPRRPGRSPAAGWAASCRQQSLSPPRVTRTACSGASGEALCLQDKLPGVQDPLQSGHRLPFLPLVSHSALRARPSPPPRAEDKAAACSPDSQPAPHSGPLPRLCPPPKPPSPAPSNREGRECRDQGVGRGAHRHRPAADHSGC